MRMLHRQFLGAAYAWWRTTGRTTQILLEHEGADRIRQADNPIRRAIVDGETTRRRLDVASEELDFPVLHELKAAGGTDYLALPVSSCRRPRQLSSSRPGWLR